MNLQFSNKTKFMTVSYCIEYRSHCTILLYMKKKFLVPFMALVVCLTIGFNYSVAKESNLLSNSLANLTKIQSASAEWDYLEDLFDDDYAEQRPCEASYSIWDEPIYDSDGNEIGCYFYDETTCDGDVGTCTETSSVSYGGPDGYVPGFVYENEITC